MIFTQDNSLLKYDGPHGGMFQLTGFHGTEGLSSQFVFGLTLSSPTSHIPAAEMIGQKASVSIELADGGRRYFNGILSAFSQENTSGEDENFLHLSHYNATLSPWTWQLGQTRNHRIFQNLTVAQIAEKIFQEKGLLDYRLNLTGAYDPYEYTVQYGESDLDFILRLLEHEGIFYFFSHEEKSHTLILGDSPDAHAANPGQECAACRQSSGAVMESEDKIHNLHWAKQLTFGKYTATDYNFTTPPANLLVAVETQDENKEPAMEWYDYPGRYEQRSKGETYANLRMQAEEAKIRTISGTGNCRAFASGYRFTLTDYDRQEMNNKPYVLTSVSHSASEHAGMSGGGGSAGYQNTFECIPHEIPFRPALHTNKPVIAGHQTAVVTGPQGEEIHTDEHGRVKVQFHWDREGKLDENTTCWVRVAQMWAGAGWGSVWIPRIGQEVVVSFENGDPDRPLIVGTVYNGHNTPPYSLPDNKTISTIRSNSTKGGQGSNELRFEDKKDSEEIYLHGQKDWTIVIENDKNQKVGHDETLDVSNNRTKTVGVDQSEKIGKNKTIDVGENHTETIGKDKTLTVQGKHTESIKGDTDITMGGELTQSVTKGMVEKIGKDYSINIGKNAEELIGDDKIITVGRKFSTHATGQILTLSEKQVRLESGSATVVISSSGEVTINGTSIMVKATGEIVLKGSKVFTN